MLLLVTPPAGWAFHSLVAGMPGTLPPGLYPPSGSSGALQFAWFFFSQPAFPISFSFRLSVPDDASGPYRIDASGSYREGGPLYDMGPDFVVLEAGVPSEGEGEGEGEGEPDFCDGLEMCFDRQIANDGVYTPGSSEDVTVHIYYHGVEQVKALSVFESFPPGWKVTSILGGATPALYYGDSYSGIQSFVWINIPAFPMTFTYRISSPVAAPTSAGVTGAALYRLDGPEQRSNELTSTLTHD